MLLSNEKERKQKMQWCKKAVIGIKFMNCKDL